MQLLRFECRGFRCLADQAFEPGPRVNVVRGDNAQGKTSILEGILFAVTSKSHRTSVESELARHGEDGFHLALQGRRAGREVAIHAHWYRGTKRFKVNGVYQARVSDVLGQFPVVLFSPDDIDLVKGSAVERRRFLDMELSQVAPAYLNALQQYRQALRQRNELLRAHEPDNDQLDAWDEQLVRHGAVLVRHRQEFLGALGDHTAEAYRRIASGERLELRYQPDVSEDLLRETFKKVRRADVRRQMTTRGPHRDDVELLVAGEPARNFGSQGQQKSTALALRLAEVSLLRERIGEYPVLMLDEVLSELDDHRSRQLFSAINDEVQCILTTTESNRRESLFGPSAFYRIERGCLEKE